MPRKWCARRSGCQLRVAWSRGVGHPQIRPMTEVEQLAAFVCEVSASQLSKAARGQLKTRVLDSLGVAIAALEAEPIGMIRAHLDEFGGTPLATLIGGGRTAPDRAAFYN